MKSIFILTILFYSMVVMSCVNEEDDNPTKTHLIKMISDYTIYSNTKHSAFTCLSEYEGHKLLAFREGDGHRPQSLNDYGHIIILQEKSDRWYTFADLSHNDMDLRDPFILKVDGRLRVYCGFNQFVGESNIYQHSGTVYADLTENGWTEFKKINDDSDHIVWIWKIRKFNDLYYGVGYLEGYKPILFSSVDGINWKTLCEFDVEGVVSEADMVFLSDYIYVCLRKDKPVGAPSLWGKAKYPFVDFEWKEMEVSVASPDMQVCQHRESILLAGRQYAYNRENLQDTIKVSLFEVNRDGHENLLYSHTTTEYGDKGYPSLFVKDNVLQMSYYEGTTSETEVRLATFVIE